MLDDMQVRLVAALVVFTGLLAPAMGQDKCVAPTGLFEVGQYACLVENSKNYLARCENSLNVLTWKRVLDYCPGSLVGEPTLAHGSTCRANGQIFPAGSYACLTTTGRGHLARCDMSANSPSWTTMPEECEAMSQPIGIEESHVTWLKKALDLRRGLFGGL